LSDDLENWDLRLDDEALAASGLEHAMTVTSDGRRYYSPGNEPFSGQLIDIDPQADMLRYMNQSVGGNFKSLDEYRMLGPAFNQAQQEKFKSMPFTPLDIVEDRVNLEDLTYIQLMWYRKNCQWIVEQSSDVTEVQKKFVYEQSFKALIQVCKVADEVPDLMMTELINGYYRDGLHEEYPALFGELSLAGGGIIIGKEYYLILLILENKSLV